jgi:DUF438 domain-containing protein
MTEKLSEIVGTDVIIDFPTGKMKASTLDAILGLIPFEMGFCDENDIFRWYTNNPNRVHPRRVSAIGKNAIEDLHPSAKVHVKKLLDDFRSGAKDEWEFWFPKRSGQSGQTYQKFMAVRDENGKYLGCFDVTMNLSLLEGKMDGKRTPENIEAFQKAKTAAEAE